MQQIVAERESVICKRKAAENLLGMDNFKDIDCQYLQTASTSRKPSSKVSKSIRISLSVSTAK